MNDKSARAKLKKINEQRNADGVGRYHNSRRERCSANEEVNKILNDIKKGKTSVTTARS